MERTPKYLRSGEREIPVFFNCAAARLLDPEGKMDLGAFIESCRTPEGIRRGLAAGMVGAGVRAKGAPVAFAEALEEAERLIDAEGLQPAADVVSRAYLDWVNPRIAADAGEGDGAPKA